jgi:hypothetical protein
MIVVARIECVNAPRHWPQQPARDWQLAAMTALRAQPMENLLY